MGPEQSNKEPIDVNTAKIFLNPDNESLQVVFTSK
jgi:hypothetical protein